MQLASPVQGHCRTGPEWRGRSPWACSPSNCWPALWHLRTTRMQHKHIPCKYADTPHTHTHTHRHTFLPSASLANFVMQTAWWGRRTKEFWSFSGHMGCRYELRSLHDYKPSLTGLTLYSSTLLRSWFLPLCQTLVSSCHFLCKRSMSILGIAAGFLLDLCATLCWWCPLCRCHATLPLMLLPCHTMCL